MNTSPLKYERVSNVAGLVWILLLTMPFVVWGGIGVLSRFSNDIRQWLPKGFVEAEQYDWFIKHFGVDEMVVADRAAVLSDVVATAGVTDMAEGIDLLATSEDIEVQSALVGSMSEEDLDIGMRLASIAGRMQAVSNVTATLGMPRITVFLREQGAELQSIASEAMLRSGATRALAAAMSATGANVAELGANEMAEGLTRLAAAEEIAIRSEVLAGAGAADLITGAREVAVAEAMDEVAKDVAVEGVAEVAMGSAELGAADVLHAEAEAAKEEEEDEA